MRCLPANQRSPLRRPLRHIGSPPEQRQTGEPGDHSPARWLIQLTPRQSPSSLLRPSIFQERPTFRLKATKTRSSGSVLLNPALASSSFLLLTASSLCIQATLKWSQSTNHLQNRTTTSLFFEQAAALLPRRKIRQPRLLLQSLRRCARGWL